MIGTGINTRVKIQDILSNQLPQFILDESPLTVDFLNQYYISQEHQSAPVDLVDNLDQYLNLDNLTPNVIENSTNLTDITTIDDKTIFVNSTKGFPNQYGLLKIDDEIITYTGITTNSFTGCERGFSGITSYHADLEKENLVFSTSTASEHSTSTSVENLSVLFLKEFYQKIKSTITPGLQKTNFAKNLNVGNFLKNSRSLYQSKGTDESFRILFRALFDVAVKVINLEEFLIKPSSAKYVRRDVAIAEVISGNPLLLMGQSLFKSDLNVDINTSISQVEPFTRNNKQYFKFELFVGFDNESEISNDFTIIPNTKCLETVSKGSSVISVDSTVGFATSGTLVSGSNTFSYGSKTINQFLDCTNVPTISPTDNIRSSEVYYSYEDGDLTKKVELRFTGVLNEYENITSLDVEENDELFVKNVGDKIFNPTVKNYKQTFANSWIYNTSSTYEIKEFTNSSTVTLFSEIDKSSLKEGDKIELLKTGTNEVVYPLDDDDTPYVNRIDEDKITVSLERFDFTRVDGENYKIRRKLNKAFSDINAAQIFYGNNNIISDVQNLYVDEGDNFAYVTSNSLPSYNETLITKKFPFTELIETPINEKTLRIGLNTEGKVSDKNDLEKFSTITFEEDVSFLTGTEVFYQPSDEPLVGLETGSYFIKNKIDGDSKKIKLYNSRSSIPSDSFISFVPPVGISTHVFTLIDHKEKLITPQKLLKKFPLKQDLSTGIGETTKPGQTGMLINGVEITNYKSDDKIYFGPLNSTSVLSGGDNFDVVNEPKFTVSTGTGTTALVQPVINGSVKKVFVDPQEFDINSIISIGVTGGNGSNCLLEPVIVKRFRSVIFDSRTTLTGGGINTSINTITFLKEHGFVDGQEIVYDNQNSTSVSTASTTLFDGSVYFASVLNNKTIRLYNTFEDQRTNTNPINLISGGGGIQKFRSNTSKNNLSEVIVINSGENYRNKKLLVKPIGILTNFNTIQFTNHGFETGDVVQYSNVVGLGTTQPQFISGLSTEKDYFVNRIDNNKFQLYDAGIGATDTSNFERGDIVEISSTGTGFQQFSYPKIRAFVNFTSVGLGTTSLQTVELTPVVKGSLTNLYLYENGTGYGSTILNYHKKPNISIKNGKDSALKLNIINGQVDSVSIDYGGTEYFSTPDLIVNDTNGTGAELRPIIINQKITDVVVINPGLGYSTDATVTIKPSGSDFIFDTNVRPLTLNKNFGDTRKLLSKGSGKLKYTVCGYSTVTFNDGGDKASPIIGWAYDGNPIYGPYGREADKSGSVKLLTSSYIVDTNYLDRPSLSVFPSEFFVEDFKFDNSGDLDLFNGRYEVNDDFPNGVYAYHVGVEISGKPKFPYFIGDKFQSKTIESNFTEFDQSFDFNSSGFRRNTFPYKVSDPFADNDFLVETNEITQQKSIVESVSSGTIENIKVVNSGQNYKVNDNLIFDNTKTSGDGLTVRVSKLKGKDVTNLDTTVDLINDVVLIWNQDQIIIDTGVPHNLNNKDAVVLSGLSTDVIDIDQFNIIGVSSFTSKNISTINSTVTVGLTTEINVSNIPSNVSIGGSIIVGIETMKILNVFDNNVLRIKRSVTGTSHSATSPIIFLPNTFKISKKLSSFDSKKNSKVFFNPTKSVGVGTTPGLNHETSFVFLDKTITRNIPTQKILITNHPFFNNQKINLSIPSGKSQISVSTTPTSSIFNLPTTNLHVVNSGKDLIGLKTGIGATFSELFFRSVSSGNNSDEYLFESDFNQITGNISKFNTKVTLSTSHTLSLNDEISLNVKPTLNVGIGTFSSVNVKRDLETGYLLFDQIGLNSTGINTITNTLTVQSHNLNTGDKVKYDSNLAPQGLVNKEYFVFKVNDNDFKLTESYLDSQSKPPVVVGLGSTGGSVQTLSKINPRIDVVKNNNIVFDLSDSSLNDYNFKVYFDSQFDNEFVSIGSSNKFNVVQVGTSLTIGFSTSLPSKLYYNLEKSGFISTVDSDVIDNNEINYVNSNYTGEYKVSSIGSTTFNIFLNKNPERLSYNTNNFNENIISKSKSITYKTTSTSSQDGIGDVQLISGGTGYKKLPVLSGSSSTVASDATVDLLSNSIGNIKEVRILNDSFEYSTDKTLNPNAPVSPLIRTTNGNTIGIITVTSGGQNYSNAPKIIIVDPNTGFEIVSGYLEVVMNQSTISNVLINDKPNGLPDERVKLITTNNSNGVSIKSIDFDNSVGTSFTCFISTPLNGFKVEPFEAGDEVFIEGVQKYIGVSTLTGENLPFVGSGHNSSDYKYSFLRVSEYNKNTNPRKVIVSVLGISTTGSVGNTGLSTFVGIAVTNQNNFATIINKSRYPVFDFNIIKSTFLEGEKLKVNNQIKDLFISKYSDNYIKVIGSYELKVGDVIIGEYSNSKAEIREINESRGIFKIDFSSRKNIGWDDEIGKLSVDNQVTPDNNYFQNLSYSVKSEVTWDKFETPVNDILHTSGLKNFADTEISSTTSVGIGSTSVTSITINIVDDKRVDTVKNIDLSRDKDPIGSSSKFLEFKNIRLSDFVRCNTNNVLTVDDVSEKFSNIDGRPDTFLDILNFNELGSFTNLLVRINSFIGEEIELQELLLLNSPDTIDGDKNVLIVKSKLNNIGTNQITDENETLGDFSIEKNQADEDVLRFTPKNQFDIDYDFKILENKFTSPNTIGSAGLALASPSGIGSQSLGVIRILSSEGKVESGITSTIISLPFNQFESYFVNTQIISGDEVEFVESYLTHDTINSYYSEYYADNNLVNSRVGIFSGNLSDGDLSLSFYNDTDADLLIKSKIIGIGTTGFGNGEHRFLSNDQIGGQERSVVYQGITTTGVGTTSIIDLNKNLFNAFKSVVEVSIGSSKALHQVYSIHDGNEIFTQPAQFLSVGSTSLFDDNIGLGTFGGIYDSNKIKINFYPDDLTGICTVKTFNQCFYILNDTENIANDLDYGSIKESIDLKFYNAINGVRINRTDFKLKSNNIPIFSKSFNPSNSLNASTGIFTINDHFFRNNEELEYKPDSTIVGVGTSSLVYKNVSAGINTVLTEVGNVFCIKTGENTFQISTTRAGTAITFTDLGEGNAHKFTMSKRNEKTIITLDGLMQDPIAVKNLTQTLLNNNGNIGASSSVFSLSGISSVLVEDIIKIDDEFMVINNVGVGTSFSGPITPGIGTFPLIEVDRASLGSESISHDDETTIQFFTGSFNIEESTIHFSNSPIGNPQGSDTLRNLPFARSTFAGRVYFRDNYDTNIIFDDISDKFTGINSTFNLTVGGASTIGVGTTGNGLMLINGIFQNPSTFNNPDGNFNISQDTNAGVTTVNFTGLTVNNELVISDEDVNQNQLPRGGVIVSLGSSSGLGFAPLSGAKLRPVLDSGEISGLVGVATTGPSLGIITAFYNNTTGILTITTQTDPDWVFGEQSQDEVQLINLPFSGGLSIGGTFSVVSVAATNIFGVNIGIKETVHDYQGGGEALPWYGDLTFGSGYHGINGIGVTVVDLGYEHRFVSANTGAINRSSDGAQLTPTNAIYNPVSGIVTFTVVDHGLSTSDNITLDEYSIIFKCSKDNFFTDHPYPRPTDPAGGGASLSITKISDDLFTVNVGTNVGSGANITAIAGVGGTAIFTINAVGSNYKDPKIFVSSPSYSGLGITGISRLGEGLTTNTGENITVDLNVGPVSTNVGIGSTLFEVKNFKVNGNGNAFKFGDKFTVVGLVTDANFASPIHNFELEVRRIYNDRFTFFQFGEFDFIDSIRSLQNGSRVRFPIKYNQNQLSVEEGNFYTGDISNVLIVFRNGVLQEPTKNYIFEGGTSLSFTTPPSEDDDIQIYFYRGTAGTDSIQVEAETSPIEKGDTVQVVKNAGLVTSKSQDPRVIFDIKDSDEVETNIYFGQGINEVDFKPLDLLRQKRDLAVNDEKIPKTRQLIETLVFPSAKVIGNITNSNTEIFVDDASLFNYENDASPNFDLNLVSGIGNPVAAALTAIVSGIGTIESLSIVNAGAGYTESTIQLSIGIPTTGITSFTMNDGTIGVGSTATATATITNGSVSLINITNPGLGYTNTNPPKVLAPKSPIVDEIVSGTNIVFENTSGIITGIGTTVFNSALAIKFTGINTEGLDPITIGDPLFIYDTTVGNGVTSTDVTNTNVVGIGTTFVDNVYIVAGITTLGVVGGGNVITGIITCTIDTNTVGIATTETSGVPIGKFSLGKISSISRSSNPISIGVTGLTVDVGLTTFPTVIRRSGDETLRKTGALKTNLI
tara:strand:+ start:2828 stop:15466 length:12639 start_codon:yes stop_codon:yes gene_type:complete